MTKGKKGKDSNNEGVDSYRHEAKIRKNAPPVGLASYDTLKPKPKRFDYEPDLDPQLIWSGKKSILLWKNWRTLLEDFNRWQH